MQATYSTTVQWGSRNEVFQIEKRYTDLRGVSEGSYGFVVSANDSERDDPVAIKKITNFLRDPEDAKRIAREIKLLRHLGGHAGVISLLDIMTSPPGTTNVTDVYLVCPLMESDLERIISSDQPLTDAHAQYFTYQLLRSLKYIASAKVIHRDLKPGNLLVNANCDLCVCDFGLARGADADQLTEYVVTRWYRAPELLLSCSNYTSAIDVWSAGCIVAELLGRKPLLPGKNYIHQLELIITTLGSPSEHDLEFVPTQGARDAIRAFGKHDPSDFSLLLGQPNPLAIDLLSIMLEFNPDKRCSVEEALSHPWLAGYRDIDTEMVCREPFTCDLDEKDTKEIGRVGLQRAVFNDMIDLKASFAQEFVEAPLVGSAKIGSNVTTENTSEQQSYQPVESPDATELHSDGGVRDMIAAMSSRMEQLFQKTNERMSQIEEHILGLKSQVTSISSMRLDLDNFLDEFHSADLSPGPTRRKPPPPPGR